MTTMPTTEYLDFKALLAIIFQRQMRLNVKPF